MNKPETSNTTSDKTHQRPWFILLLVIGLAATGLCIYFSVINLTRPYIGATLAFENQQWVVQSIEDSGLANDREIKPGDIVISVNRREPVDFPQEYIDLKVYAPQAIKELSVKSNGETIEISAVDSSIPSANTQETVILSIISFLFLLIGFFVFIKKGVKRYSVVFYLTTIVAGLEFVAVTARERNLFLSFELQIIVLIILPWLAAHLFWIFPARKKWLPRLPRAEYLLYVPCIIMVGLFFAGGHTAGLNTPWFSTIFAANLVLGLLFALIFLFHSYTTATSIKIRQQTKIIFAGMLLAILPLLLLVVLPSVINNTKIVPTHIASLSLLLIPLTIGYTIVKYQLMGIRIVLRKGTSFLLISSIVVIPYVLIIYLPNRYLPQGLPIGLGIPLLILFALAILPVWRILQNKADRWFYRQRYDFMKNLELFSQEVHDISDINKFGYSVVELLNQALEVSHINLLLLSETGDYNSIATTAKNNRYINLKNSSPIVKWLRRNQELLYSKDLQIMPLLQSLTAKEQSEIQDVELFTPLVTKNNELVGIFLLGNKSHAKSYSQEDEKIILTIAKRVAIELENARLYNLEKSMRKELEEQDEQKTEFLYSIAHELKTPLAAIISSSDLLSNEISDRSVPREENLIRNVVRSAWWMNKRVTELLDLAKLEIAAVELTLEPVSMGSIIKDIASRLFYVFKNKGQVLKVNVPRTLPKASGDLDRIEQILFNLLSNANKYSPTDSVIMLHAAENYSTVVVAVEDSGPIISEDDRKRIFEPYFRGSDYDMIKRLPGLGLGLAICKKLVEQHQGEIWVKPKPEKGNIFSFSIPIYKPEKTANTKRGRSK